MPPTPSGRDRHRSRRSFLRYGTGTALTVLAVGAETILNPRPAAASHNTSGCCNLLVQHTPWCTFYCLESGGRLVSWGCNNMACLCYECYTGTGTANCWRARTSFTSCSAYKGCCFD